MSCSSASARGRIAPQQTQAFLDALLALNPIIGHAALAQVAGPVQHICRDHGLTPYDALYVELALRAAVPRRHRQDGQVVG